MRDTFDNFSPMNAMTAAQRAARPVLRRRFYREAKVVHTGEVHAVRLDHRPIRTPVGRVLCATAATIAQSIAAEWEAQGEAIELAKMPLTRLANSIIDGVADRPEPVAAEVEKYLASDLLCYRASKPQSLVAQQSRLWDPILTWASETLGVRLCSGEGIMHIAQPAAALVAARAAIPSDPWRLGAVHAATTLTGSALIALALARGRLAADAAWQAAHLDEDWNMEQWGRDPIALERRAFRFGEFQAAATVLRLV